MVNKSNDKKLSDNKFTKNQKKNWQLNTLSNILDHIETISKKELRLHDDIKYLIDHGQKIIENMRISDNSDQNKTYMDNNKISNQHQNKQRNNNNINKYQMNLMEIKNKTPINAESILKEEMAAKIRAGFREAKTKKELEGLILEAKKYNMDHEIKIAQNLIERLNKKTGVSV